MDTVTGTLMYKEAREAADGVLRQAASLPGIIAGLRRQFDDAGIQLICLCARGSSDHAGLFAKYLFERELGIPVSSVAPSIASVHGIDLRLPRTLFLAISQSGQSPDILQSTASAARSGAITACIVNDTQSKLAELCDIVIPMEAGPERSVAATKSFICSLSALCAIAAALSDSAALRNAIDALPASLHQALEMNWRAATNGLVAARSLFVLGRGVGFAIASEAALKLKETCALHAEAFSAAEVQHGPMELIENQFVLLVFETEPAAHDGVDDAVRRFIDAGASVFLAGSNQPGATVLPSVPAESPYTNAILQIQSFYLMANDLSLARGRHPDTPKHLQKVTETR